MSILVDTSEISEETAATAEKDLRIVSVPKPGVSKRYSKKVVIHCLEVEDGVATLPFYYTRNVLGFIPHRRDNTLPSKNISFQGTLTEIQKSAKKEVLSLLTQKSSCVISFQCGLGKTAFSIYLFTKIGKPSLVLVHRVELVKQWERSIKKFTPTAKVEICNSKNKPSGKADFYIMNMTNVSKLPRNAYGCIDVLIVDEVHVACAEMMSRCLFYITPLYAIGLSATPKRSDGLDKILDVYFGPERIVRIVNIPHTVYRLDTGIIPEVGETKAGDLDWNSVISSQTENQQRNDMIAEIVKYFPDRTWLILSKRVNQAKYLYSKLIDMGEDVTCITGSQTKFDTQARIVVSTYSKTGVGFDHPSLDALLLASDVDEGIEQYHGRVFRRTCEPYPIIVDIVDDFPSFKKHWYNRRRFYKERKGVVENFMERFPDFPLQ